MLKHEGRKATYIAGREVEVENEGKPLDGKHVFRNQKAQKLFDKKFKNKVGTQ